MRSFAPGIGMIVTMLATTAAHAQSADATATIEAVESGAVLVTNTADLNFGAQPIGSIVQSSDVPTAASWNIEFVQTGQYSVAFTLPSSLIHTSTGASVPISFGSTSASSPQVIPGTWDPSVPIGLQVDIAGVALDVLLGADVDGSGTGDVWVDLGFAQAGTYQGVITLTVAAL